MGQEREIQYRDQVAATYETGWYIERMGYWADWLEKRVILNRVNPQQDDVILDAGCGTGRLTQLLASKSKKSMRWILHRAAPK
jgi:ubiquinone/menaquinone biosynthesis C-methylase UbiE